MATSKPGAGAGGDAEPERRRRTGRRGGSGDNVVDADFEEVKDDKKKSA